MQLTFIRSQDVNKFRYKVHIRNNETTKCEIEKLFPCVWLDTFKSFKNKQYPKEYLIKKPIVIDPLSSQDIVINLQSSLNKFSVFYGTFDKARMTYTLDCQFTLKKIRNVIPNAIPNVIPNAIPNSEPADPQKSEILSDVIKIGSLVKDIVTEVNSGLSKIQTLRQ